MKTALIFIVALMAMFVLAPMIATACTGCGVLGFVISADTAPVMAIADGISLERAGPGESETLALSGSTYMLMDTSGGIALIDEVPATTRDTVTDMIETRSGSGHRQPALVLLC